MIEVCGILGNIWLNLDKIVPKWNFECNWFDGERMEFMEWQTIRVSRKKDFFLKNLFSDKKKVVFDLINRLWFEKVVFCFKSRFLTNKLHFWLKFVFCMNNFGFQIEIYSIDEIFSKNHQILTNIVKKTCENNLNDLFFSTLLSWKY